MSRGVNILHSHSGIEVEMKLPKHIVLVDEKYKDMFSRSTPYSYNGNMYLKVSTKEFADNGGVFKFLRE